MPDTATVEQIATASASTETTSTGASTASNPVAAQPQTAGAQGSQTADAKPTVDLEGLKGQLKGLPAAEIAKILAEANPEYAAEVSKSVRKTHVESLAEKRAAELQSEQVKALQAQLETLTKGYSELATKDEQRRLAGMSDAEREKYSLEKKLELAVRRNNELETKESARAEEEAKAAYLDWAKDKYRFNDDEIKVLAKAKDTDELFMKALELKTEKESKTVDEIAEIKAQIASLSRQASGASTFAATGGASASGGDMSFQDLQRAYVADPDNKDVKARYEEAYRKRR